MPPMMIEGIPRRRFRQRAGPVGACTMAIALIACAAGAQDAAQPAGVLTGLDVLLRDGPGPLAGRRAGLITNHTGTDRSGASGIDLLHAHPDIELVALFSPEHAITGRAEAGERIDDAIDPRTGLPIRSLYGETRKPTAAMLEDIDVLVFDIQDIGTRYYTYVWTMTLAMQAAAEHGRDFVVLDRPNPIGGALVQGNVLDPAFATFVGLYPVPMRHGLTPGELARLVNDQFGIGARLTVVPMAGWTRDTWYDGTELPWTPPSPNMPHLESAAHYAGTCLFEGTNLSVGRGTPDAFRQIGAPWLDHAELVRRLDARAIAGVRFDTVTFTPASPGDGRHDGVAVRGVRLTVTDRATYDPVHAALATMVEIQRLHADSLTFRTAHFDRLAGTDAVRLALLRGADVHEITAGWDQQIEAFRALRRPYLLYPENH